MSGNPAQPCVFTKPSPRVRPTGVEPSKGSAQQARLSARRCSVNIGALTFRGGQPQGQFSVATDAAAAAAAAAEAHYKRRGGVEPMGLAGKLRHSLRLSRQRVADMREHEKVFDTVGRGRVVQMRLEDLNMSKGGVLRKDKKLGAESYLTEMLTERERRSALFPQPNSVLA